MKMKQIFGYCLGLLVAISVAVTPIFAVSSASGPYCQVSCSGSIGTADCSASCPNNDAHCIMGTYYVECGCSYSGQYVFVECGDGAVPVPYMGSTEPPIDF